MKHISDIEEIRQDIKPDEKFRIFYKKMMKYYTNSIVKHKLLLRYHLFPAEEISNSIREKYVFWTDKENEIILDIINECIEQKFLGTDRVINDYLQQYKKFENSQVVEMIISNIKIKEVELDMLWVRFWNCTMRNSL